MSKINLEAYGITGTTEIVYNPSYEVLFEEETKAGLEGYEVGQETELGAVNVMTGIYTGRSPKDKYIVMDENLRIQYGGHQMSIRTITTQFQQKFGLNLRTLLKRNFQTRDYS